MENYKERYEEAIRIARKQFEYPAMSSCYGILKEIFPELKESEDERIRKALVRFHKSTIDIDGIKGADILAWLEKQGQTFTKKDVDDAYLKGISDAKNELEKQGEQKPADKVEPRFKVKYAGSEYNVLEVKDIAGVTFYGIEDEPNHIDYVKAENCEIITGYAIKENGSPYPTKPAVFSEKKPAAWSKDDEEMFQSCTGAIWAADYYLYEDKQDMEAWLKSLKDRIGG